MFGILLAPEKQWFPRFMLSLALDRYLSLEQKIKTMFVKR